MENLELNNTKRYALISGFKCEPDKLDKLADLQCLLWDLLGFDAPIEDIFSMGQNNTVIIFQNVADKRHLMEIKGRLKGHKNQEGKQYYINEYNPPAVNERKNRERYIMQENEDINEIKEEQDQVQMTITKGGLKIGADMYRKKVTVPSPTELVDIPLDKLDHILHLKVTKSGEITQKASRFIGFSAVVANHEEVRQYYMKMKLNYPTARHIVCAYSVPGNETYYTQDFCDDGEPGAGRRLLDILVQSNIDCRAVFVARYYGGIKMGLDRFECYEQAAQAALMKGPYNHILGIKQILRTKQQIQQQKDEKREQRNQRRQEKRNANRGPRAEYNP